MDIIKFYFGIKSKRMKLQKGFVASLGQGQGQSKELLNIPISISLLHEQEYENIVRHLQLEKRRSLSEKNKSNMVTSLHPIIR